MAGFLDEWRKPSRLLQDVKTKSIERTLLPLLKQVRENFPPLSRPWLHSARIFNETIFCSLHLWLRNGKLDGKLKLKFSRFVNETMMGIILVFVGCYFKMLSGCSCSDVCKLYRLLIRLFLHSSHLCLRHGPFIIS